jgi:ribosomal protein L14
MCIRVLVVALNKAQILAIIIAVVKQATPNMPLKKIVHGCS